MPQPNTLSLPPPVGSSVAASTPYQALTTSQGSPTSFDPRQIHRLIARIKGREQDRRSRPKAKLPIAVGPWLANSLEERWQCYRQQLRRSRRRFSEDSIHELRVATRRLMALFTLLSCVPGGAFGENGRRVLKRQLKALNGLRDAHVQGIFLEQQMPRFTELFLVRDYLRRRERRLAKRVASMLDQFSTRELAKRVTSLCAELNRQSADARRQTQLLAVVMTGTAQAFVDVVARRRAIDPADLDTIHRTRVAFKRFRYLVESLSPAFTGLGQRELRALGIYQRRMGNLQDLEVVRHCLDRFAQDHAGLEDLLRPFCRQLQRRRARLLRSFLRSKSSGRHRQGRTRRGQMARPLLQPLDGRRAHRQPEQQGQGKSRKGR